MENNLTNKNWISIKDEIPILKTEQWKDRYILISKPVKVKRNDGTIYTARYFFSLRDFECNFPKRFWQLCLGENMELPMWIEDDDCWMELPEEHEGE